MKFIFQTERLLIRELTVQDAKNFYDLNEDPEVLKHTGDKPFKNIIEAELFLKNYDQYNKYGFGRWAVIHKESKEFLGWCGLKQNDSYVDLGFRFFRKHWNKGYATEAAKACLFYAEKELNIENVIARTSVDNIASQKVLEKLNMVVSGKSKDETIGEIFIYKKKGL